VATFARTELALSRKLKTNDIRSVSLPGQFRPKGGVTMRDSWKSRGGFDRALMAVAATFLTVSATSALAQSDTPRATAAELAIEAAIPRPQPANLPPVTADDFKMDATESVPPKQIELPRVNANTDPKPAEVKPAETTATVAPAEAPKTDTATTTPAAPAPAAAPAPEPVKAASTVPAADQPVADKLREQFAAKNLRYLDRKG
jgi:hypothetical protein